jgi:hypothetical protein
MLEGRGGPTGTAVFDSAERKLLYLLVDASTAVFTGSCIYQKIQQFSLRKEQQRQIEMDNHSTLSNAFTHTFIQLPASSFSSADKEAACSSLKDADRRHRIDKIGG